MPRNEKNLEGGKKKFGETEGGEWSREPVAVSEQNSKVVCWRREAEKPEEERAGKGQ